MTLPVTATASVGTFEAAVATEKVCLVREWNRFAPMCPVPGRESRTRTGVRTWYVAPVRTTMAMPFWLPLIEAMTVSVAVTELVPTVLRVTPNV